jgi:iron-sulfur cluster assembly protein
MDTESSKQVPEIDGAARAEFAKRLAQRGTPNAAIRLGVKGGGCKGFSFQLSYEDEPSERDREWTVGGTRFVIDPKSLIFLSGSRVVWKDTVKSKGFDIENPQETSRCGCGHSFSI